MKAEDYLGLALLILCLNTLIHIAFWAEYPYPFPYVAEGEHDTPLTFLAFLLHMGFHVLAAAVCLFWLCETGGVGRIKTTIQTIKDKFNGK